MARLPPAELEAHSRRVADLLQRQGILFLNPIDALKHADQQTRMYYFIDIHLTPAGNRVVADLLFPPLRQWLRER